LDELLENGDDLASTPQTLAEIIDVVAIAQAAFNEGIRGSGGRVVERKRGCARAPGGCGNINSDAGGCSTRCGPALSSTRAFER